VRLRGDDDAPTLPGMPEPLVAATPTRLTGWVSCPRRYRFTYLQQPTPARGAPWAHTAVGAAVHLALARWWREDRARRTPGRAAALLGAAWVGAGFRDAAQERTVRDRTADQVARYTASLDPAADPVGIELTVTVRTGAVALSGRIDRLDERIDRLDDRGDRLDERGDRLDERGDERHRTPRDGGVDERGDRLDERGDERHRTPRDGGVDERLERAGTDGAVAGRELVVVDYKTGRWVPSGADAASSLALAVYAAAAARTLHRRCRLVELHHLPSGQVASHRHTQQSVAEHLVRADSIVAKVREATARWAAGLRSREVDGVFPPRPGPACAWCDFRVSCPEGARASPRLDPWAGVDDVGAEVADQPPAVEPRTVIDGTRPPASDSSAEAAEP